MGVQIPPIALQKLLKSDKMNKEILGNLTTIIKLVIMTIAPAIAVYLEVHTDVVIAFLTACLTFALAILDAKYPNTVFNTEPDVIEDEVIIEDIDPAGDYDD